MSYYSGILYCLFKFYHLFLSGRIWWILEEIEENEASFANFYENGLSFRTGCKTIQI